MMEGELSRRLAGRQDDRDNEDDTYRRNMNRHEAGVNIAMKIGGAIVKIKISKGVTVSQRQTILAIRVSEHWKPRLNPSQ